MADETVGLSMAARIALEDGKLVIAYAVRNRTTAPVLITDKVVKRRPEPFVDPANAYVWLDANGTLFVAKELAPIPQDRDPTELVAPLMTLLKPGERLEEEFTLDVPVHPHIEYADNRVLTDEQDRPLADTADSVVFRLGYFAPPAGSEFMHEEHFGAPADNFRAPPGTRAQYGTLTSAPAALTVPVLRTRASAVAPEQ